MKRFAYILGIISSIFVSSCDEKEVITYSGKDGIYFDVRWGADFRDPDTQWGHQYYTPVEFGNMADRTYQASLRVTASGTIKEYDRPFTITIGKDSTDAIEGEDYEPFPMDYVLKAGERYAYVNITFNRTERMRTDTVTLQVRLQPNEYFDCPFTNYADNPVYDNPETEYGYNPDATVHKVVLTDMMSQPTGWVGSATGGLFGAFSPTKWLLIMELTNTDVEDYNVPITQMLTIGAAYSEILARYLVEQAALGQEHAVLDEDGSMMWCDYVKHLAGANAWTQGEMPDDYYARINSSN